MKKSPLLTIMRKRFSVSDWVRPAVSLTVAAAVIGLFWPFLTYWFDLSGKVDFVAYSDWLAGVAQPIAIFWFVLAFMLQHEELKLQRKELSETRQEFAKQASAARELELTTKRSTFIGLRAEYQGLLDDLSWRLTERLRTLRDAADQEARALGRIDICNDLPSPVTAGEKPGLWLQSPEMSLDCLRRLFQLREQLPQTFGELISFLRSGDFRAIFDSYTGTYGALLDLAAELGVDGVLVSRVRSTDHFRWYRLLFWLARRTDYCALARGKRPTDRRFAEAVEKELGLPDSI